MPLVDQASTAAEKVDNVFFFILALCVAFLIFITALMVFFVIKYRRKKHPRGEDIEGHAWLEIVWTLVPLVLFLVMFYYGWTNFAYVRSAPRDAMVVKVTGRQWAWDFEYPNGKRTTELYLALDKPVRMEVRSADVIHGFYVPAFRIKMDAVPGKENYTWFTPTRLGSFDIECSVICGANHTYMVSRAIVVSEDDFKAWYFGGESAPPPGKVESASAFPLLPGQELPADHPGLAVLKGKQCLSCHSTDGSVMVGPTFKGAFGAKQVIVAGGAEKEVLVDEAYLAKSMREPMAEVLKGYPPAMPHMSLSDSEIKEVIEYIRSIQ
jgi:cytochrome c oxidase subunit 2